MRFGCQKMKKLKKVKSSANVKKRLETLDLGSKPRVSASLLLHHPNKSPGGGGAPPPTLGFGCLKWDFGTEIAKKKLKNQIIAK